jgi:hypothetical protein
LPDKHVAIFEKHRAKIGDAASAKFDCEGVDPEDGEHEDRPVLMVRSDDLKAQRLIGEATPTMAAAHDVSIPLRAGGATVRTLAQARTIKCDSALQSRPVVRSL